MANEVQVFEYIGERSGDMARPAPSRVKQTLSIGGSASNSFDSSTAFVTIVSTTSCVVEFGAAPTGAGDTFPIVAGQLYDFDVRHGQKVIAVAGTATAPSAGLPTGAATAANQATEITSLASIDTKLTTQHADELQLHADIATTLHADLIAATPAGANIIGAVKIDQTTAGTTNAITVTGAGGVLAGVALMNTDAVNAASYYALATLGYTAVFNGTTWDRQRGDTNGTYTVSKPVTSGGLSLKRLIGAASGVIKASAGQLYSGTFTNSNAAVRYLQVYDKTTAGTLSTDTPVLTVPLPPNVSVMIDFAGMGAAFTTGISWQLTTDDIAIPTTAGSTTDIHGFATFK